MLVADDTIVAVSTASGRAAISVVRMSGERAHSIARRYLSAGSFDVMLSIMPGSSKPNLCKPIRL